jgi:hypothetical protein
MRLCARLGLLAGMLAAPLAAHAQTEIYANNFEWGLGAGWGTAAHITADPAFTSFVGRYTGSEGILLTVNSPSLPPVQPGQWIEFRVVFDFFAIDSWDGDDITQGPDIFYIKMNGSTVFAESFANQHTFQSFRAPDIGPDFLAYRTDTKDSIYRNISVPFTIGNASTININWYALGLQGLNDESWGIDNVRVNYSVVPAPGTAGLLTLAAAGLLRRRR